MEVKDMLQDISNVTKDNRKRLDLLEAKTRSRKWADLPGVEPAKFSFLRAFQAIRSGNWSEAGYEKEVFNNTQQKAGGYTNDTSGGYLVPAQAIPELIELLRARSVCIAAGATVLDDLAGSPVLFPKQTGGATVYWVGENTAITPNDLAFGQLSLTPHKAASLIQVSNSLIRMSLPSADRVIKEDVARQLALAIDLAALRGTGSNNMPLGVANTPGIGSYNVGDGTNGAVITNLDAFAEMEYQLAAANALVDGGKFAYIFHPAIRKLLKKIKVPQYSGDTGVLPLVPFLSEVGLGNDKAITDALGYPFFCSTQLPVNLVKGAKSNCTEIYFANWQELLIGQWQGLSILASQEAGTAFASDQTWIRVIAEVDIGLRHTASFVLSNDAALS